MSMSMANRTALLTKDRTVGQRWRLAVLIGAGLLMQTLLLVFILLYVNFPAGYNVGYGLSLDSIPLFRELWGYPVVSLEPNTFARCAAVAMLGLWVVYLSAAALIERRRLASQRRPMIGIILAFAVVFNITLVLAMPPILSSDIYHYGIFGRMVSVYGQNPYVLTSAAAAGDIFWPYSSFHAVTSRYGPVWTLIEGGVALLGGNSVLQTVLVFKGVAALFNLANCLLVFVLVRRFTDEDGLNGLLLYAWNPLILLETAGAGHNDGAMMALALLGVLLAVRGRLLIGLGVLLLSAMIKYITALLVLFIVVRFVADQISWRVSAALLAKMAAVGVAVIGALYLPFTLAVERPEQLLAAASPAENNMPNPLWHMLHSGWSALATNVAGIGPVAAETYLVWGLNIAFVGLVVFAVRSVAVNRSGWPRMLELWGIISLTYIVLIFGASFPWYLVSTLTIAFVGASTRMNGFLAASSTGVGIALMLMYARLILG